MSEESNPTILDRLFDFSISDARALLAFLIVGAFAIIYFSAMPDPALMGQVVRDFGVLVGVVVSFYFTSQFMLTRNEQEVEPEETETVTIDDIVKETMPFIVQTVATAVTEAIAAAQTPVVNTSGFVSETPVEAPVEETKTDSTVELPPATDATVTSPVETA